jgi:hypothetical protein
VTHLILKRASFSRPSGTWQHEDYDVLADGKVIGRIYERGSAHDPPDMRWFWSITEIAPALPNKTNGHAATLDEAKAKFRTAWNEGESGRLNAGQQPARHRASEAVIV